MIRTIKYSEGGEAALEALLSRTWEETAAAQAAVDEILSAVKKEGDEAVIRYTERFDKVTLTADTLRVTEQEIQNAVKAVAPEILSVLRRAYDRIVRFHEKQKRSSWMDLGGDGEMMGQILQPMQSCGVYAPGGKAAYPSTVLMNIAPARIAGVQRIVMVTPPNSSPVILAAADVCGITEIYKVGGAQAIAALAYGTRSIPKVDKIVGPGNIFVALAKKSVFGEVSIDSVAGPSEILILADDTADERFVAADMLSQAEHDEMASAVLVTDSVRLIDAVRSELEKQTAPLSRKEIIRHSLDHYGALVLADSMEQCIEIANRFAPEHLEILTADPYQILPSIHNAGAIFMGPYAPEPLGDYMAGPNHVLPTGGTARFFSPLSVDDFIKKSSVISFSKKAFTHLREDIIQFAESEGLTAHAAAARIRES